MMLYDHQPQFQRGHRIQVQARIPNSVFDLDEDGWGGISKQVVGWLERNIGPHREEWEFSNPGSLWFRTREQAMFFKLSWAL